MKRASEIPFNTEKVDSDPVEQSRKLFHSLRGALIVGQALHLAIKEINARPTHEQEPSNVEDMEFLLKHLFPLYRELVLAEQLLPSSDKV